MNCLTRIRQRYPTLAASDKKLADYILSQPDETRPALTSTAARSLSATR